MLSIEDAIAKYSGGDDAYALKLKTGMRDAMGYSNYMSKLKQATSSVASIGDTNGLSPAGIKERIGSRFGAQDSSINTLSNITGAIDSTAGSLASAQVAREKAASAAADKNQGTFAPQDWLDKQILEFQINRPKNEDGTQMTPDQFKEQIFGKVMGEGDAADLVLQPGLTPELINSRVDARTPKDYNERSAYYQARQSGATKAEAENLQSFDDYTSGKMKPGQKTVYELLNPPIAKSAQELGNDAVLMAEAKQKDEHGDPKFTFQQIVDKHPGADPNVIKKTLYGDYKQYAQNNAQDLLNSNEIDDKGNPKEGVYTKNVLKGMYNDPKGDTTGTTTKFGLDVVHDDPTYKKIKARLISEYFGVLTEPEIQNMLDTYILK